MAPGPSYAQQCVRRGTMALSTFLPYPPTYSITELSECGVFSSSPSCFTFTGSWSPTGGGETGSYIDCYTGQTVVQVFPDLASTTMIVSCAQSGSFRVYTNNGGTVSSSLGSVRVCQYAGGVVPDPKSSRCISFDGYLHTAGRYGYSYQKCNGDYVLYENVSDETTTDVVYDCVRLGTLKPFGTITAIYTGSYCGYYSDTTEYTNIYMMPFMPESIRDQYYDFVSSPSIIDPKLIYRPLDPNFGIQKDIKFRNALKGIIIGLFTVEEYSNYIKNSSSLNKRMMTLLIERYRSQIQLLTN
jgi:hypothetical protein